jgi:hypothetical protein
MKNYKIIYELGNQGYAIVYSADTAKDAELMLLEDVPDAWIHLTKEV